MAKKQKDKETKSRKGKAGVVYGLVMIILIAVSVVLACTVFFRVEEVEVEGNDRYSVEQILTVADVEQGSNLILTPGDQIANRIYKSLPYVDQVDVRKRFPTTIRLVITESQPVAVLPAATVVTTEEGEEATVENGDLWIIDAKGKLLEKADESLALQYISVAGLQVIEPQQGETAQVQPACQKRMETLLSLLQALENRGIVGEITHIDSTLSTEVSLVYDGRITGKLLSNTDFDRKLQIFQEIVALTGEHEYRTVNLKTDVAYDSPSV